MRIFGLLIIVGLLAAGAWHLFNEKNGAEPLVVMNSYTNDAYGISFSYPAGFALSENGTDPHTITLIREADAATPENGEGPVAVTIALYKDTTLDDWLATSSSNLALGDGITVPATVAGAAAVSYHWSGLYEGETTAFAHGTQVVAVSVTTFSPADTIKEAYRAVLDSFSLR